MSLRTLVKISNVTNLSDARYCAGMGVEWLGFSMDSLPVEKVAELRGWVAGVRIVGETTETDAGRLAERVQTYQPDAVQVETPSLVGALGVLGVPVLVRVDVAAKPPHAWEDLLQFGPAGAGASRRSTLFVLENSDEFAQLDDDSREALDALSFRYPLLLGFGLTEGNVLEVLNEIPNLKGLALRGGDELRPGYKDFGELMNLLERLETEA
jgi:phosphoribosylanthranilate isomerase